MSLTFIEAPSPNFDARTAPPEILVLHYTGMKTGPEALDRLRDPEAKVSSHYMVEEDGRIFRLVPEERRAGATSEWPTIMPSSIVQRLRMSAQSAITAAICASGNGR